jgi:hypothetical protein
MRKLKIFSVSCVALAFLMGGLFAQPTLAIPGDVNGNGVVDSGDIVYLLLYLFMPGSPPPPNPIDADVDGSPGINLGDVLQLEAYLFFGYDLIPYTGVSIKIGSGIWISSTIIPPDTILYTSVAVPVKIIGNEGPDLTGFVIPISYASEPGQVEVTLDSVSFAEGIVPGSWYTGGKTESDEKRVVFHAYAPPGGAPIDSGTTGTIAKLHFTRTSLDPLPLVMSITQVPPSHSLMLISAYYADGTSPSERIFTPKLSLARKGDCNGDGEVDIGDVVHLINYLFLGTSPPIGL